MKKEWKFPLLFIAYALGALYIIFSINTEVNLPYYLAFKYLTIPWLILSTIIVFIKPKLFMKPDEIKKWKQILLSLLLTGLMTLFSGPYVSMANALLPPQEKILIEGHIVSKCLTGKYHNIPEVVLDELNSRGEPYRFEIKRNDFENLRIGDQYSKVFTRGGLGFVYNWK